MGRDVAHGRRARSRREGTAFVEAIVILPVLGTLLASVLAVSAIYSAKLDAKAFARRLAWLQADSGRCVEAGCAGGECDAVAGEVLASGVDALSSVRTAGFSLRSFVGDVGEFFVSTSTRSIGTATRELPTAFGRRTHQTGVKALVCNTAPGSSGPSSSILDFVCKTDLKYSEYAGEICD